MSVQTTECPNCGAAIDFRGGQTATCPYCHSHLTQANSAVKAASASGDDADLQLDWPGVDVGEILEFIVEGNKLDAIKSLRKQTGLDLQDAQTLVEALERGEAPDLKPYLAKNKQR